jgi:predicted nucleotide-binding protein
LTLDDRRYIDDASHAVERGDWLAAARALSMVRDANLPSHQRRRIALLSDASRLRHAEVRDIVLETLSTLGAPNEPERPIEPMAFIVHGWDAELKLETKNYLQNTLGLNCIILHEQDGRGGTLIDKFEHYARPCDTAFVLLSADDDAARVGFDSPDAQRRPRPNVLFEMGYFFARLGRERVVILRKGEVEIHSDILGIEYIDVSNGVDAAGELVRRRLKSCF